jgi:S1-C subfamily serine protease
MMTIYRLAIFLFTIGLIGPAWSAQDNDNPLSAIVKIRAVVPETARTAAALGTEREGSGVVIDSEGLILTIGYLILEAESIEVVLGSTIPVSAYFVAYDHETGFGLLRTVIPLKVEPVKLGRSADVKEGDEVMVAAYGGMENVRRAYVMSRGEFAGYWEYLLDNAIYTAPAHPNFGGAALIGRDGRLLGIGSISTQMTMSGYGQVSGNMFVPIDLLKPIREALVATGRSQYPVRPWLGVYLEESHGRVIVTRVAENGPAEKAGLQPGDIIVSVNSDPVSTLASFYRRIWALGNAGVEVPLEVLKRLRVEPLKVRSADRHQYLHIQPVKRKQQKTYSF